LHPFSRISLAACLWAGCHATPRGPSDKPRDTTDTSGDSGVPPGETVDLVVPEDWVESSAEADPFLDHRPAEVDCDPSGFHPEDGIFEIETELCAYASLVQGSRSDIAPGDTLSLLVFHSALAAPEPATAHAAIVLDGRVLWEEEIPIPAATEIYATEVTAARAVPQGSPIVFHVHNHGANSWKLGHLRRLRD